MARAFKVAVAFAALVGASPLFAQAPVATEKHATRHGFSFPVDAPIRILLFRPEIKIGEQTTAGMFQNNVEWHSAAQRELTAALVTDGKRRGIEIVAYDDTASDSVELAEHRALFRLVVSSIFRHKFFGKDLLPTKKDRFDWSLGSGVARIAPSMGASYGLFLLSQDSYPSSGRSAAMLVSSLIGNNENSGTHLAYAALFDLKGGEIVWLSADLRAAGDVRTGDGAVERIGQLMAGFPTRKSKEALSQ